MQFYPCENHVHIILGKLTRLTEPGQVSWPIYGTREVIQLLEFYSEGKSIQDREEIEICRKEFLSWAHLQLRDRHGRFTRRRRFPQEGPCISGRIDAWFDFAEGREKQCNFILCDMATNYIYALSGCRFVEYIERPIRDVDRWGVAWSGKFKLPE